MPVYILSMQKMMTTAAAKKYINDDHFQMYRKLGGKLTKNQYRYVAAMFVKHTIDIFVGGDCTFYPSRQAAVAGFQKWANEYGHGEPGHRIFRSIDLVTPYT